MADIYNMADTWDAGGTIFSAIKMDVTDTASATGSMLMDLRIAGLKRLDLGKDRRLGLYNLYIDDSNWERGGITWLSNQLVLSAERAGTGTLRSMALDSLQLQINISGTGRWIFQSGTGHMLPLTNNATDIGATGTNTLRSGYFGTSVFAPLVNTTNVQTTNVFFQGGSGPYMNGNSASIITLLNNAGTGFNRLNFGGSTSSFPALRRSATVLQARLADDSAFAPLQGVLRTDTNATTGLSAGALAALTNASITITDASGQVYRIPCII